MAAIDYDKNFASRLRLIPLEEARDFYKLDIATDPDGARIKNVIDLLINRKGINFNDAIEKLTNDWKNPPMAEYEIPRRKVIFQQLSAIGADKYRVTAQNLGTTIAEFGGQELFTKFEILENNRLLYQKNTKEGRNIYITPQETDTVIYLLVDDANVSKLSAAGYSPNILQQTSQNSFQAIFIMNREFKDRNIYIELFNMMNKEYGDKDINGLRHAFRLAGFQHVKKGGFVTKVLEIRREPCTKIHEVARQITENHVSEEFGVLPQDAHDAAAPFHICEIPKNIRKMVTDYQDWIIKTYSPLDRSRGDFMLAGHLRQAGASEDMIYTALLTMPLQPNPNPERYAMRTTVNSRPRMQAGTAVPDGERQDEPEVGLVM